MNTRAIAPEAGLKPLPPAARLAILDAQRGGRNGTLSEAYERLVKPNWAPWFPFVAKPSFFNVINQFCPEGQIVIRADEEIQVEGKAPIPSGTPIAMLNLNRIMWDGNPQSLPTWDQMFGSAEAFAASHNPQGNTFVMLNINVDTSVRGMRLPEQLIARAIESASVNGVQRIIGAFRPSDYGTWKLNELKRPAESEDFERYCALRDETKDNMLQDGWLRNLERNGMKPIGVSRDTMVLTFSIAEYAEFMHTYKSSKGSNGDWHFDLPAGTATYSESRLFGTVWENSGERVGASAGI